MPARSKRVVNDIVFGRVYKLYSIADPEKDKEFYVGSTETPLNNRIISHCASSKKNPERKVFKYLNQFDKKTWRIELVFSGICENRKALLETEEFYRVKLKATLNQLSAFCSKEQKRVQQVNNTRKYRASAKFKAKKETPEYKAQIKIKNREQYLNKLEYRKAQQRAWNKKNKAKISIQKKAYYRANTAKILAYQANHRKQNREQLNENGRKWRADQKELMEPARKRMKVAQSIRRDDVPDIS